MTTWNAEIIRITDRINGSGLPSEVVSAGIEELSRLHEVHNEELAQLRRELSAQLRVALGDLPTPVTPVSPVEEWPTAALPEDPFPTLSEEVFTVPAAEPKSHPDPTSPLSARLAAGELLLSHVSEIAHEDRERLIVGEARLARLMAQVERLERIAAEMGLVPVPESEEF